MALKAAQIAEAMRQRRPDGQPRFDFVTGYSTTADPANLDEQFGAWRVTAFPVDAPGLTKGEVGYYRIPLTAPRLPASVLSRTMTGSPPLDLESGLERRLSGAAVADLEDGLVAGRLNGAIANKLSLSNFVTPGFVRSMEMLRALAPRSLGHLFLTSGRSEMCDKCLRALKYHRRGANTVVSVGPVFAGRSTAAARSVTLSGEDPDNWFGWPSVADPTVDPEGSLEELRRRLTETGERKILGVVIEPVFTRTGRAVEDWYWVPLRETCDEFGVPLILIENATAGYRNGRGMWRADSLPIRIDAVWWFPGGQLGLIYLHNRHHVRAKKTLISTWDGDELSLLRLTWELRHARNIPVAGHAEELSKVLERLGPVGGEGLYLSVATPHAKSLRRRLLEHGVRFGLTDEGHLLCAPSLDIGSEGIARLRAAIQQVITV